MDQCFAFAWLSRESYVVGLLVSEGCGSRVCLFGRRGKAFGDYMAQLGYI